MLPLAVSSSLRTPRSPRLVFAENGQEQVLNQTLPATYMALPPTFGCKCLNVRIYPSNAPQDAVNTPKIQEAGFEWVYIDKDGLQMVRKYVGLAARINNMVSLMMYVVFNFSRPTNNSFSGHGCQTRSPYSSVAYASLS